MGGALLNDVAALRRERRLSQAALAARVGVSRQALGAIESGRAVPSTIVALELARELGVPVERVFQLAAARELSVVMAGGAPCRGRATLSRVAGRWVAHPLERLDAPADAELHEGRARLLGDARELEDRVLLVGCDPALGLLAAAATAAGVPVAWVPKTSAAALDALGADEAHVAGSHLYDPDADEHNVPFVRARIASSCALVELAATEEGLVVAPGNPHGIAGVRDLVGRRIVNRPVGAGARALLERELRRAGVDGARLAGWDELASGHEGVARRVREGQADAGIATLTVARAQGLGFVPLGVERFDLVVPVARLDQAPVRRLFDVLARGAFRRQLEAAGGYGVTHTGREVART